MSITTQLEQSFLNGSDPVRSDEIAFVGAYHREGHRLARILNQTEPWFKHRVIALQAPEKNDLLLAQDLTREGDHILVHPKLGFGEASFPRIMEKVRELPGVKWVFYMDGDELAEPLLLAGLRWATQTYEAELSGGVRLIKRSNIVLPFGEVLPGLSEINLRIWKIDCERPPKPHAWIEGIVGEPAFWRLGAVRETRTLTEYIVDQLGYVEADPDARPITRSLLDQTYRHVSMFVGALETQALFTSVAIAAQKSDQLKELLGW